MAGTLLPGVVGAQAPLTLGEAVARADTGSHASRLARTRVDRAASGRSMAVAGLLPTLRLEGGYTRSNDPLVAFGFLLRQRAVTPASFDPGLLNAPPARGDMQVGGVVELPLLNLDAWSARSAVSRALDAESAGAKWVRASVQLQVLEAWAGAVVARERVLMLEAAHTAARSHVRQAARLAEQGVVTRSDVLLAEVKSGAVEVQLAQARGDCVIARHRLALAMGAPDDTLFVLPDSLPAVTLSVPEGVAPRADVEAARYAAEAEAANAAGAGRAMLPRLNAFGRYDWHDQQVPFGGTPMWTAGIQMSWSPFTSPRDVAARRTAQADAARAREASALAAATAEMDRVEARVHAEVAVQGLGIAERSVAQSAEAHRVMGRKYEGGLVTITELLDAAALETSSRVGRAQARYEALVASGALWRASGHGLEALAGIVDGEGGMAP